MRCCLWRQSAERAVTNLTKGARVIAEGVLRQRCFETKDGEKRTVIELDVDEIGASPRDATVRINRATAGGDRHEDAPLQPASTRSALFARPVADTSAPGDDDYWLAHCTVR